MKPVKYNLPDVYRGDTAPEVTFKLTYSDGTAVNLTSCGIKAEFVLRNTRIKKSYTEDDNITISDPTSGEFILALKVVDWKAGLYDYDIEITFPDTKIRTYVHGTMTVIQDITNSDE